jgi:hypothetical protein
VQDGVQHFGGDFAATASAVGVLREAVRHGSGAESPAKFPKVRQLRWLLQPFSQK